jgi:hypothetical protein
VAGDTHVQGLLQQGGDVRRGDPVYVRFGNHLDLGRSTRCGAYHQFFRLTEFGKLRIYR